MNSQDYYNPLSSISTHKTISLKMNDLGQGISQGNSQNNQFYDNQKSNYIEVIFRTSNSDIKIKCNIYDNFSKLIEKLYKKAPQLSNLNNYFLANNKNIYYFKTLKENNIKNDEIIYVCIKEENNPQKNNNQINKFNNQKIKSNEDIIDETKIMETIALTQLNKLVNVFLNNPNINQNNMCNQMRGQIVQNRIDSNPNGIIILTPIMKGKNNRMENKYTIKVLDVEKINVISELIKNTNFNERILIYKLYSDKYINSGDLIFKLYNELADYNIKHLAIGSFMNSIEYDATCLYEVLILPNEILNSLKNNNFYNNMDNQMNFNLNNNFYDNMNNPMNKNQMNFNLNKNLQNNPMEQSMMKTGYNFLELSDLEKILIEIIGSRSSTDLKKIKNAYFKTYKKNLDNDVASKTS